MVTADLRDPDAVLSSSKVNCLIDFSQPVAVMLVRILHHLHDEELQAYFGDMEMVPPGLVPLP